MQKVIQKVMQKERIRAVRFDELPRVKELTDKYIGDNFYTIDYLEHVYYADKKDIYVCTDHQDYPVAFFYIFSASLKEALEVLNIAYEESGLEMYDENMRVGVYKTSCTDEAYRGRGIFRMFLPMIQEKFMDESIRVMMLPALRTPNGMIAVQSAVTGFGFEAAAVAAHPWSHIDSPCPYCGNRYCQCDAVLYKKEIKA